MSRYRLWARFCNACVAVVCAAGLSAPVWAADGPVIVALGDSLTAGWGLSDGHGFATQLQVSLAVAGVPATVINAGVSGDTSAGGRARLDWALADAPDLVIVELGANDGLRGLDPAKLYENLDAIVTRLRGDGIEVLLTGMRAPPNLGREYADAFHAVFPALADKHDVTFYPFFLDGVAAEPTLNQGDGIHPNAAGVEVIIERITPYVLQALDGAD